MVNCGLWLLSVGWAVVIFKKCFLKLKEQNYCFYFHSCTQLQRFNSSGLFDERPGAMSHSHPFSYGKRGEKKTIKRCFFAFFRFAEIHKIYSCIVVRHKFYCRRNDIFLLIFSFFCARLTK